MLFAGCSSKGGVFARFFPRGFLGFLVLSVVVPRFAPASDHWLPNTGPSATEGRTLAGARISGSMGLLVFFDDFEWFLFVFYELF